MPFLAPDNELIDEEEAPRPRFTQQRVGPRSAVSRLVEQVQSAREQSRARASEDGGFLAPDADIARANPAENPTEFLADLRRTGVEQERVRRATETLAGRFDVVQDDMAKYGILDWAGGETALSRAINGRDAGVTEADRRAEYAAGFEGREFWNTDRLRVDVPFGADGQQVEVEGLSAQTLAAIADIGGAIAGAVRDPTAILGGGRNLMARIASNMGWNAAADVAGQGLDMASGAQEGGYQPERTVLSTAAAVPVTVGMHYLGRAASGEGRRSATVPEADDASTVRASRGADTGVSNEADARALEDATNRARMALRERGINPNAPGYRAAFEAERAAQMRQAPQQAAAPEPGGEYVARARADLQREGITPRAAEDYADRVRERAARYAAEDTPEAQRSRADAEARQQAAFENALLADPNTRVRTTRSGAVSYVRDTGNRARGRFIVDEVVFDEATGGLRVVRQRKALPGELRDIPNRPAPSPAPTRALPAPEQRQQIEYRPTDETARDTSGIPRVPEETVRSELMRDPAAKVRTDADQDIVRDAAGRGIDPEAVERYRASVAQPPAQGGEGRALTFDEAVAEMQARVDGADKGGWTGPNTVLRDGLTVRGEPSEAGFTRRSGRNVSRETAFTKNSEIAPPYDRTRTPANNGASFSPTMEVGAPKPPPAAPVSRETEFTNNRGDVDVPLRPIPKPQMGPALPDPARVAEAVGGRIARKDPNRADGIGEYVVLPTRDSADKARNMLAPSFERDGQRLIVEATRDGFGLRVVEGPREGPPPVRVGDETVTQRAGPLEPATPKTDAPDEVAALREAVGEFATELRGITKTLAEQRAEMDDAKNRAVGQAIVRGAAEDATPPARVADDAPAAPAKADDAPLPMTGGRQWDGGYMTPDDIKAPPLRDVDAETRARADQERPGLGEATERRQRGAEANRTFEDGAFGERERSRVDGIPGWRHDVTPDRMARDTIAEIGRPTDPERFGANVQAGKTVAAVLDSQGNMRALDSGTWTETFSNRAGLGPDVRTSQILYATRSADIYGHGRTMFVRVSDDLSDETLSQVSKLTRALDNAEPDLELRLEVHFAEADPQVFIGRREIRAALETMAMRDNRPMHNDSTGAFRFMDPSYWGAGFRDAADRANEAMSTLLGDTFRVPREDLAGRLKNRTPSVTVVNRNGDLFDAGVGESHYWFGKFRQRAKLKARPEVKGVRPDGTRTGSGARVASYLENDVLNITRTALIENMGGKVEIRMPARVDAPAAAALRDAVNAVPMDAVRARIFDENGNSPMATGRDDVLAAIDKAADAGKRQIDDGMVGAMPFLDPAAWNRHLIQPSTRAMMRYLNGFQRSDPDRVAFWREVGEAMRAPSARGSRRLDAARTLNNLHDTMVVSDIGALRGMARRTEYKDVTISAEEAARAGDPSMAGRNPIQWLADQVGSQPGSGRVVPRAYELEVSQDVKRFLRRIDTALAEVGRDARTNQTMAELVTGQRPTGPVTAEMTRAAENIRRAFNDEWDATTNAGVALGRRKNYLMRNFDEEAVVRDPQGFIKDATDQYVDEGVDPAEALAKARSLWTNIAMPVSRRLRRASEMDSSTPNPIAARQWSASADVRMRRWYVNDIRKLAPSYIRRIAMTRSFARRFGADGERLTAAYDAINRQVKSEADRDLVLWHMNNALGQYAQQHGKLPITLSGALSWIQVLGVTKFLARTFLLQLVEPAVIATRENKGAVTALQRVVDSARYLVANSPKAQAERQLADIIGLTGAAAKEMYLDARLNGLVGNLPRRFVNNVFDAYGITTMTERQRIYAMTVGERVIREALNDVTTNGPTKQASLSLLGEYGIAEADAAGMKRWIDGLDNLPREDRYDAIGYGEFGHARAYRGAIHDFAVKSILEPTAGDTPGLAKHPYARMAYSLQSYQHTFTREVMLRVATQAKRAVTDGTLSRQEAAVLLSALPAFVALAAVQIVMQAARDATFSSQASTERTPLERGITAVSRTGALGQYDTAFNALSSNLRYERDPAGLASGPYVGDNLNSLFEMFQGLPGAPSNSERTNSAEWQGNKELYSTIIAPSVAGLAAQVPMPAPLNLVRVGASAYGTSSDASRTFATGMAGERGAQVEQGASNYDGGFDATFATESYD